MVEPTDFKDEPSFLAREIYCVFYFLTKIWFVSRTEVRDFLGVHGLKSVIQI